MAPLNHGSEPAAHVQEQPGLSSIQWGEGRLIVFPEREGEAQNWFWRIGLFDKCLILFYLVLPQCLKQPQSS